MTHQKPFSTTRLLTAISLLLISLSPIFAAETKTLWLDEVDLSRTEIAWGAAQSNKSVDGNPLTINAKQYSRGVGTHADSDFNFDLDGKTLNFSAVIGVDSEIASNELGKNKASIEFIVLVDQKEVYKSGLMKYNTPAKNIDIDLKNAKNIRLIVSSLGDMNFDHADWVNAKIEYAGKKPELKLIKLVEPYILTPKPGPAPRITGPKVFGARAGNPFLFTLTATGNRPMEFDIKGLPVGLRLDSATGCITGMVVEEGTYITKVTAKNDIGKAERALKIIIGDKIALTPPMGWNSWNCWACAVDDEKVRASAKSMVDSGLINHGWSYINIDDCWMRHPGSNDPAIGEPVRDKYGFIRTNEKFPDMRALTDYIHDLGLKTGIYISPGPNTCAGYLGSWEHELLDAQQFAEWGFDYLKYDWCGYSRIVSDPSHKEHMEPYLLMAEKLSMVNRDIIYSLCQYGWDNVWEWGDSVGGNCWRTTGDITDTWSSMAGIGFGQADHYPFAGPGHWNDPDMLVVGKVGWGPNLHDSRLTPDEQYTHISLWCLLSSPLLIGCPIEQMDEFTKNLLTNDEVLDVNQDPLGNQAKRITNESGHQVWSKEMEDGSLAVGIFNMNSYSSSVIEVSFKELGLKGLHTIRDLWRQKDLTVQDKSFTTEVAPHGVTLVRFIEK